MTVDSPDGSVSKTKITADGTRTESVENPDGSGYLTVITPEGTTVEATIDSSGVMDVAATVTPVYDEDGYMAVQLPIPALTIANEYRMADTITISTGGRADEVKVTIPVADASVVTVAVIVHPDGTETIIRDAYVGESATVTVPDGTVLKFINNEVEFDDVSDSDWFAEPVKFVASHELFDNVVTDENRFLPEEESTRGMLAQVLHNLSSNPAIDTELRFTDVSDDDYYSEAVKWAAEEGIISGYEDETYGGAKPVTREELALMLYRFAGEPEVEDSDGDILSSYSDSGEIADYSMTALQWAAREGIMKGNDKGELKPKSATTRAEIATMIQRFCKNG